MFSKDDLTMLHRITHETLDLVIDHAAKMPAELFTREIEGFGRSSVCEQLCHVLSTESAWISGLQDSPILRISSDTVPDAFALRSAQREVAARTLRYLDSLTPGALNANITNVTKDWVGPGAGMN